MSALLSSEAVTEVYIGLGSNWHAEYNLAQAITYLIDAFDQIQGSSIYSTSAMPSKASNITDAPDYLNMVIRVLTDQTLEEVQDNLKVIEQKAGQRINGLCPLDLDLLLFGDLVLHNETVDLPRKDIDQFAYVAIPLAELAPDQIHPESGQTFAWYAQQTSIADQAITKLETASAQQH